MTKQKESFSDKVFRFSIPHVLVLILLIILFCCGLTYILPAGLYEIDPQTGLVVPNSSIGWKVHQLVPGVLWLK